MAKKATISHPGSIRKSITVGPTTLSIVIGDITAEETDAIVNAANSQLWLGGGVAGAIHRKAGHGLEKECRDFTRSHGPVNVGEVAVTSGGLLKARFVIHAVGPVFKPRQDNEGLLRHAIESVFAKVREIGARSVAIPAVSTGIFGFPKDKCADIMIQTVAALMRRGGEGVSEVRLVNVDQPTVAAFETAFDRRRGELEDIKRWAEQGGGRGK